MTSVVFYFQVHQPYRLRRYSFFDIGVHEQYFDDVENARIVRRVAEKCYVPMNALLLEQIERHQGRFRCAFSVSGTAIGQMEEYAPEALESFQRLARTGCVEFRLHRYGCRRRRGRHWRGCNASGPRWQSHRSAEFRRAL